MSYLAHKSELRNKRKSANMEYKFITFCLRLDKMNHISKNDFRSTTKRVSECKTAVPFKFVYDACPYFLNEKFLFTTRCRINT